MALIAAHVHDTTDQIDAGACACDDLTKAIDDFTCSINMIITTQLTQRS